MCVCLPHNSDRTNGFVWKNASPLSMYSDPPVCVCERERERDRVRERERQKECARERARTRDR